MNKIRIYKSDDLSNVRLQKYFHIFHDENLSFEFVGWKRTEEAKHFEFSDRAKYLLSGGGYGKRKQLFFLYILFLFKLFFNLIKGGKKKNSIVINFDVAVIFYLSSFITNSTYIYEIHDAFSLSYNLPKWLKKYINLIDKKIMQKADLVIHVDENRIVDKNHNNVIIYNSPLDYFENGFEDRVLSHTFAVIGNISETRGALSIYKFAKEYPNVSFLVVGKFYDHYLKNDFISLKNVIYHEYLPQSELFHLMLECCGIFSLYNPQLEINRLAASNKVYDAMMLGIPVITNPEVANSKFILENKLGFVINYNYDKTWKFLMEEDFVLKSLKLGKNGRLLYEQKFEFEKLVKEKLIKKLQ